MANLFERLPVRRKQFLATARDEFQKLLNSVQAFALSRTDVRFIVKNMIGR
jgi:DNA mismatch repair ATPase MutL